MNNVSLDRLLKLMQSGIYFGCLAVIIDEESEEVVMHRLREKAQLHYRSLGVLNLDKESSMHLASCDTEMILVHGLEKCPPQSAQAHGVRTSLDIRRNRGMFSIICLDRAAYLDHFWNSEGPFYHFCDSVEQCKISDFID